MGREVTKCISGTIEVDLGRTKLLCSARVLEESETVRKILLIKPRNIQRILYFNVIYSLAEVEGADEGREG